MYAIHWTEWKNDEIGKFVDEGITVVKGDGISEYDARDIFHNHEWGSTRQIHRVFMVDTILEKEVQR